VSKVTSMLELSLELSKKDIKLNQNTTAGAGGGNVKPITSHSLVGKVTSMVELHLELSKK
jgi:hypothetical protein